jgi:hypothetical protein
MIAEIRNLEELLQKGVVEFTYSKVNGETRKARGTRCWDVQIVGENFVAPNGRGSEKTGVLTYWDLDKDGWRSLQEYSLLSIEKFTDRSELC